jgi:hypothetical protein
MRKLSTHRLIQISQLLDTMESNARICRQGCANLARIGNSIGATDILFRAQRMEYIARECRDRLEEGVKA